MSDVDARYLGLTANQLAKIATDLNAKNVRLRELVADMRECALVDGCYACEYGFDGACGKRIAERQRELGVVCE